MKLTSQQTKVLNAVREFIREHGYPPTRRDVADMMGFSSANAAEEHLQALEHKKTIHLIRGISRGIQVL